MFPLVNNLYRKNDQLTYLSLFSIVTLFQLFLLAGLYFLCNNFRNTGMDPLWIGRKGMVIVSLVELSFFSLLLPLALSFLFRVNSESGQRQLLMILPDLRRMKQGEVMSTVLFIASLILTVTIPVVYLYRWHVPPEMLFKLMFTLFMVVFFISAVFHFAYSLINDLLWSVMSTYLILFSLMSGVILMNPVIEWAGNTQTFIQPTLLLNPFVAVASSINLDILRTDPLYYLSSISAYQYHYPGVVQYWFCYGFIGFLLFTIKIKYKGEV